MPDVIMLEEVKAYNHELGGPTRGRFSHCDICFEAAWNLDHEQGFYRLRDGQGNDLMVCGKCVPELED